MIPPRYPHQEIALQHLLRNPRAALFLDMGYGKTRTILDALTPAKLPALVVAPKRVAEEVWPEQAERWRPDLSFVRAKGTPAQRRDALLYGADITVIGRENLADVLAKGVPTYGSFVIDELSGYKGRGPRWKTARQVAQRTGTVWGMTGTPAPNGYLDLWPQVALLDGGARLGKNITTYRSRYFTPGRQLPSGVVTTYNLREGAEEKIWKLIEDICLSMSDRIDLPPVVINPVQVALPPDVQKVYTAFKKNLVADMTVLGGVVHSAGGAGQLTNRLSQLAAGFLYVDDAAEHSGEFHWYHDEKVNAAAEVVENTGSPVLVFYRYKPERDALLRAIPGARSINEDGVIGDWNRGRVRALVAHPQSAGHGLNLQDGGHTALWTSLPWSLEEWQQANARLARPGQANAHVMVHVLMAKASVDAAILDRLQNKTAVQEALLNALESVL